MILALISAFLSYDHENNKCKSLIHVLYIKWNSDFICTSIEMVIHSTCCVHIHSMSHLCNSCVMPLGNRGNAYKMIYVYYKTFRVYSRSLLVGRSKQVNCCHVYVIFSFDQSYLMCSNLFNTILDHQPQNSEVFMQITLLPVYLWILYKVLLR